MTWVDDANAPLLTDLYELTMAASYFANGMNDEATFDLFVRRLPRHRNFLVVCGVDHALDYLERLAFDRDAVEYLRSLEMFSDDFLAFLSRLRFTGEVCAIPEGEVAFAGEPIVRVTAPLIEAQIVETFLLNCITFQTMVASKAARVAIACGDRSFVDFSPRRDHGADAAVKAARAAYIGGAAATSNVLAGRLYGLPLNGTMAHSYVMAFSTEDEAFTAFARDFPDRAVLLIDTFDVEEGAHAAARVAHALAPEGVKIRGVRIDSGDLGTLAWSVRKILDDAGLESVQIVLSGDLDEYRIRDLLHDGAPADAFGVGTQLGTSADAPYLGGVYKLVAERGVPKMKLSSGKATRPGIKQVHRFYDGGCFVRDVIALAGEDVPGGRPLLETVMQGGRRTRAAEDVAAPRARCADARACLPPELRALDEDAAFPVESSPGLTALEKKLASRRAPGA